jgi:hypothetical protein
MLLGTAHMSLIESNITCATRHPHVVACYMCPDPLLSMHVIPCSIKPSYVLPQFSCVLTAGPRPHSCMLSPAA